MFNVIMNETGNKIRKTKETDLKVFTYADDIMIWDEMKKTCDKINPLGKCKHGIKTAYKFRKDTNVKILKKWRKTHSNKNIWKWDERSR